MKRDDSEQILDLFFTLGLAASITVHKKAPEGAMVYPLKWRVLQLPCSL